MAEAPKPQATLIPKRMLERPACTFTSGVAARPTASGDDDAFSRHLPTVGDIVGGLYRLERRLGSGMFGQVYIAERTDVPEHRVALKLINRAAYAGRNVERELVMLAAATHPNIVQLKDHGVAKHYVWLTMPLYDGLTLAERLEAGSLSLREAYEIFQPIARGVQALHERGLRHQDIKPENIYLAQLAGGVHPVLLDLGVAVERQSSFVAGTALYGAPEQVAALGGVKGDEGLSEKMDIYCFAATLLYALVGEDHFPGATASTPFDIADAFEQREVCPIRDGALPELTGEPRRMLSEAFSRWLRRDAAERSTARELAEELDVLLEQEREATAAIERGIRRQKQSLARFRIGMAMVALAGLGAGAYVYSKRETIQIARELEQVKAEGAKSFERLDTCIASHELTRRKANQCEEGRKSADEAHQHALAVLRGNSARTAQDLTRRLSAANTKITTCQDDAEKAAQSFTEERDTLKKTIEDNDKAWAEERGKLETERDEQKAARLTCETATAKLTANRDQCRQDLASCISDRDTCMHGPYGDVDGSGSSGDGAPPPPKPAPTPGPVPAPKPPAPKPPAPKPAEPYE